MKTYKFLSYILALGLLLTVSSCDEDTLDEIDTNPNSPTDVPLNLLLPQAETDVAFAVANTDVAWYSSVFVQHTAGVHAQLQQADRRASLNDATLVNNTWTTIYAGTLPDLNLIIEKGSAGGDQEGFLIHVGIAKILKAFTIAIATDTWGRVPYSEIGQGAEQRQPVFDEQQQIYNNIQMLLDEAIADLAAGGPNPGARDLIYGGATVPAQSIVDSWTRAAWSLKARYYNRLSNINPTESAQQALAAAENGFSSSAQNMNFAVFTSDATGQNPWFQEAADRQHLAVSQRFVQTLQGLSDPRLDVLVAPAPSTGEITGAPNGTQDNDQASVLFSDPTDFVLNATAPVPLMTYDELKFIEAEAHLRLGQQVEAVAAFREAVLAAMQRQASLSGTAAEAYVAQIVADGLSLQDIIQQKWISFFLYQPIEAFADYRRTDLPELPHPISRAPLRFPYPQSEIDANAGNVPNVQLTDGVWWDDGTED
ncbi:SusD/RagB family nutrient-binding outer membrane lipoprotein [uncultured Pontibacter sp.]|uniref:SusD/RagB family nutrient-binding outer membrane lipoprotein n=1 Tax=uncultured Pontibacter sp. TaxID=453356 RepID=UPI0026047432|nr:SusD/RagB family nutrient-binding outer membrane lipoprotein [uncultured Pontibacter sp.]